MFTIDELERLEDCLIAFDTVSQYRDVAPFDAEGKEAESLYLLVSRAKNKLRMETEQGADATNDYAPTDWN